MNARQLYDQGWRELIPIAPPNAQMRSPVDFSKLGKIPAKPLPNGKWITIDGQQLIATLQDVVDWDNAGANLALRSRHYPFIDIDVLDEELAESLRELALSHFGHAPSRWGKRPKVGLLYRTSAPFRKKELTFKYKGQSQAIEILADGQNFNIAGTHPEGYLYEWDEDLTDPANLVEINETQVYSFLELVTSHLRSIDEVTDLPVTSNVEVYFEKDLLAPSEDLLRQAVELIPNTDDGFPSRQKLVEFAYAIRGAAGENEDLGYQLFSEFADRYEDGINTPDEIDHIWGSLKEPTIGWPKIAALAANHGLNLATSEFDEVEEVVHRPPVQGYAPTEYSHTYVADRFLKDHKDLVRFINSSRLADRRFIVRQTDEDSLWKKDLTNIMRDAIRQFCVKLSVEVIGVIEQPARSQKIRDELCKESFQSSVYRQLTSYTKLNILPEDCDTDPDVLNTPDGLIDLRTGRFVSADKSHTYHTKDTKLVPDWTCPTPLFNEFLKFAFNNDEDLIKLLRRFMGYALTGRTSEQIFLFAYGDGGTGKGMFIRLMQAIMGEYMEVIQSNVFLKASSNQADRHPTELTDFQGKRLVVCQEFPDDAIWNEAALKTLTGSDTIKARKMQQDFYSFEPTHTIFMAGNRLPSIRSVDNAIRRRVRLIPFKHKAPPELIAQNYETRIKAKELPGILAWAITGAIEWYERGLGEMPIGVVTETNEYLTNADEFSLWLEEFTKPEVGVNTPVARLYESWKEFQNNYGTPLSMLDTRRVFKEKMRMKGFVEDRTATSRIYKDVLYLDPSEGGTTLCSHCMGTGRQPLANAG